jgi:hypothetical protein
LLELKKKNPPKKQERKKAGTKTTAQTKNISPRRTTTIKIA